MPRDAQRTDGELLSAVVAGDGAAFQSAKTLPTLLRYGRLPVNLTAAG
jgi:hypothetical protein